MSKRLIEIPEGLEALGEAFEAIIANVKGVKARTGGGKAVDYAEVELAVSEDTARIECSAHQSILQDLDIDVPAVIIGGVRYTRVGRCPAPYHTMAGSVQVERSQHFKGHCAGRLVSPSAW